MTPWKRIKTRTNAAEKLKRLQGVASEPGLTTDNIGFENQRQDKLRELGSEYERRGWDAYEADGDYKNASFEDVSAAVKRLKRGLKNVRPKGR